MVPHMLVVMYMTRRPHIMMLAIIITCSMIKSRQCSDVQRNVLSRQKRALGNVKCDSEIAIRECASEVLEEFNEEQESFVVTVKE